MEWLFSIFNMFDWNGAERGGSTIENILSRCGSSRLKKIDWTHSLSFPLSHSYHPFLPHLHERLPLISSTLHSAFECHPRLSSALHSTSEHCPVEVLSTEVLSAIIEHVLEGSSYTPFAKRHGELNPLMKPKPNRHALQFLTNPKKQMSVMSMNMLSRASNNHILTKLNGAKRTWNDSAHIRPMKHEIRAPPFLLSNTERSHSVLKSYNGATPLSRLLNQTPPKCTDNNNVLWDTIRANWLSNWNILFLVLCQTLFILGGRMLLQISTAYKKWILLC
jgi:hypothetical protein